MITATTVTVNVRAMDGEFFENNQEDTNEEVYNESVGEAMEAEVEAEESVETAEVAYEAVESILEGNDEAGIEAAEVTDGGAVAQESVEAFVEAGEKVATNPALAKYYNRILIEQYIFAGIGIVVEVISLFTNKNGKTGIGAFRK